MIYNYHKDMLKNRFDLAIRAFINYKCYKADKNGYFELSSHTMNEDEDAIHGLVIWALLGGKKPTKEFMKEVLRTLKSETIQAEKLLSKYKFQTKGKVDFRPRVINQRKVVTALYRMRYAIRNYNRSNRPVLHSLCG